ncbi:MAG: shikimate kinase [Prochlorococcus sp.]|nr:shikimate kinase [Prochlorococcaceae cyanobacterium Fu_MAG_50]
MTGEPFPPPLRQRLGGRNLHLVGMMGSGKSSTGRPLAKRLGYGFVDADAVIEKLAGRSIPEIFSQDGEDSFRSMESQVLRAIGERHSLVVATGGGVVTIAENWGVLHQGIVIWLNPGRDQLMIRLQADPGDRPLLKTPEPAEALAALLKEREPLYAEADLHIPVGEESPDAVAERILEDLPGVLRSPELQDAPQTTAE